MVNVTREIASVRNSRLAGSNFVALALEKLAAAVNTPAPATVSPPAPVTKVVIEQTGSAAPPPAPAAPTILPNNPTATASDVAVNGSSANYMRSDAAPAVQKTSATQFGLCKVDGTTITAAAGVITAVEPAGANPTATASDVAVNGSATTFMRSDAAPAVQKTSSTLFGLCKVDGTTITATAGVISSTGGGGGGGFNPYFDPAVLNVTKPAASSFTLNQATNAGGAATLTNLNSRGISLLSPAHTATADNWATAEEAVLSTSAITVTALLHLNLMVGRSSQPGYSFFGLCLKDTAGKYQFYGLGGDGNPYASEVGYDNWTNLNTFSAHNPQFAAYSPNAQVIWMKLVLASGTVTVSFSHDGETWGTAFSVSATSFLGTLATVGLGVDCNPQNAGQLPMILNCYSWTQTTP